MTTDTQPTHTPAPIQKWNVGENDRGHGRKSYAVIPADFENYEIIAESPTMTYERARLIAAAPELLGALEEFSFMWNATGILEMNGKKYIEYPSTAFDNANAAIDKARG